LMDPTAVAVAVSMCLHVTIDDTQNNQAMTIHIEQCINVLFAGCVRRVVHRIVVPFPSCRLLLNTHPLLDWHYYYSSSTQHTHSLTDDQSVC
jgi:hypothetical protein